MEFRGRTMEEEIATAVARAVDKLAARLRGPPFASSSSSSASGCNIDKVLGEIKMLGGTLVWIRATLNDAEQPEVPDEPSIRLWLRELAGVAYDAEDVVDEFLYEVRRLHLQDGGFTRVSHSSSATPTHDIFAFLHDVPKRIEEINSRYDVIRKHRESLRFPESYGRQRCAEVTVRQQTSSIIEKSCIFGRDEDLKTVKKFLLSDGESSRGSPNSTAVMAIVGMGGLGKTTLAQLAYNDEEVGRHFQLKSWICASEDLGLVQLTGAMVESFSGKPCAHNLFGLNPLQVELGKILYKQRFFLVLDDVWEQMKLLNFWEMLLLPFLGASKGSKIIVTTRSVTVSKIIGAVLTYQLPFLQDEDCLKVFNRLAVEQRHRDLPRTMKDIGQEISVKCKGLPLVAKALGGLLRCEDDEQVWNDILESDVWEISKENWVMPVLRLSYQHLPAHLKRCFRYCALFPKGYQFKKDHLVWMWMAHGYIGAEEGRLVEDVGGKYFDDLLSRSFFQPTEKSGMFTMHDLVNDLATCVSGDEFHCVAGASKSCRSPRDFRHISFASDVDFWSMASCGDIISDLGILRSVLGVSRSFRWTYRPKLQSELFSRMKQVRVLDLSNTGLEYLPKSISYLKHLRYLSLRGNPIKLLPESVGSLHHLETLDISFSGASVPDSITNLLNLRHLISENNSGSSFGKYMSYPVGIGKLVNLQTMPGFCLSPYNGRAKLGELKGIKYIRNLIISRIVYLTDSNEAKEACLEKKEFLRDLCLKWKGVIGPPLPIEDEVLESLRPNPKLQHLCVSHFCGRSLPSWLGDPSFFKLASVKLSRCHNWTSLPPLGQLPSLRHLFIRAANGVEYIGHEFFSGRGFPRLETLRLYDMQSWKSWCGAKEGECPQLRELVIVNCQNLASLSLINLGALQDLQVQDCPVLQFSASSLQVVQLPSLQKICISSILGTEYVGPNFFRSDFLEKLTLVNIHKWVAWCGAPKGGSSRLRLLSIRNCANLASLHLGNLNVLEELELSKCPQLSFSDDDQLPPALKKLRVHECPLLRNWWQRVTGKAWSASLHCEYQFP